MGTTIMSQTPIAQNLRVDGDRLWRSLMEMAQIGATAKGGRPTGQIAPFSLRQRVRDLGGGCNLTVGAEGGTLVIALPAA